MYALLLKSVVVTNRPFPLLCATASSAEPGSLFVVVSSWSPINPIAIVYRLEA